MRPLILVREGSQLYLKSALLTAIESGNEVILIGDKSNKSFCDDWVDVSSIAKDILPCWDMLKKRKWMTLFYATVICLFSLI